MEFLVFQFVPIASHPVTGHHWGESASIVLTPSHQAFTRFGKILLLLKLNGPRFLFPGKAYSSSWTVLILQHLNLAILSSRLLRPVLSSSLPLFPHNITFKHGACWQECCNLSCSPQSPDYINCLNCLRWVFTSLNYQSFFAFSVNHPSSMASLGWAIK